DGRADAVPQILASEAGVAVDKPRRCYCELPGGAETARGIRLYQGAGLQSLDAVGDLERAGVSVGPAAGQGPAEQAVDFQVSDRRPAQSGGARAAGGVEAHAG